jgi:hypothetical protein
MYCLIYEAPFGFRFYTNDSEYKDNAPEEFGELGDESISFIYVEPSE